MEPIDVEIIEVKGSWQTIKDASMNTVGKETGKAPDADWRRRILLAEHSPIRKMIIDWMWPSIRYWVAMHIVRHKIGMEHQISTQRPDRNPDIKDRDQEPQGNTVMHRIEANLQSIINVSRKRLCKQAKEETRVAWIAFLKKLAKIQPEVAKVCVPDCVYRGWCFEYPKSCGFHKTKEFKRQLAEYRQNINGWEGDVDGNGSQPMGMVESCGDSNQINQCQEPRGIEG